MKLYWELLWSFYYRSCGPGPICRTSPPSLFALWQHSSAARNACIALTPAWLQSCSGTFTLVQTRTQVTAVVIGSLAVPGICTTGTVAALGDTLFPAASLRGSVSQDFTPNSPALLHFRLLHPVLAVIAGTYVIWLLLKNSSRRLYPSRASVALIILLGTEIGIGLLNVFTRRPCLATNSAFTCRRHDMDIACACVSCAGFRTPVCSIA